MWEPNDTLKSIVRKHLLKVAEAWKKFANIPDSAVTDIIMTGGNSNFNYTDQSDIDVHIVIDYSKMPIKDNDLLVDMIFDKKNLWSDTHHVTIYGYPVEMFAQNKNEQTPANQGKFSLLFNKWLIKPNKLPISKENDTGLKAKVIHYEKLIDSIIAGNLGFNKVQALKDKINNMRTSGLVKGGEFSTENLVFKSLRNLGYIDKLYKYGLEKTDSKLSLT